MEHYWECAMLNKPLEKKTKDCQWERAEEEEIIKQRKVKR